MVISKGIATAHFVGQCDEDPRQSEPEWCTNKFFKQAQQTIRAHSWHQPFGESRSVLLALQASKEFSKTQKMCIIFFSFCESFRWFDVCVVCLIGGTTQHENNMVNTCRNLAGVSSKSRKYWYHVKRKILASKCRKYKATRNPKTNPQTNTHPERTVTMLKPKPLCRLTSVDAVVEWKRPLKTPT